MMGRLGSNDTVFMNKINLNDLTFVIPVRVDCFERLENLCLVIDYLTSFFDTKIIIIEADREKNGVVFNAIKGRAKYLFIEDFDTIFYRTKYLNILSNMVETDHIAIWDSDVIVHPGQIYPAIVGLRENAYDFIFPYDGNFLDTGVVHRIKFFEDRNIDYLLENVATMHLPYTSTACGGGFLARLSDYLDCGGENENFYGWGQEDGERVKRWEILEKKITRIKGPMFHLYHPRGKNSTYTSNEHRDSQISEYYRISYMNKGKLKMEIASWGRKKSHH